jgi:CRP-like cAMP-binding protein
MQRITVKTKKQRQSLILNLESSFDDDEFFEVITKKEKIFTDGKIIATYLFKNMTKLCEHIQIRTENIKHVIFSIALNMLFNSYENDTILFNYGDKGQNFYIILKGRVDMLSPFLQESELTRHEYLDYLNMLYMYNEEALMNELLVMNSKAFKIAVIEIINLSFRNKSRYVKHISTKDYIQKVFPIIIKSSEIRKIVQIYAFNCTQTLNGGSFFGDSSSYDKNDNVRKNTVIISPNSHVIFIRNEVFIDSIQEANFNSKKSNLLVILNNPIFESLNTNTKNSYQKHMANIFTTRKVEKGEYIMREGEVITNIYFIKTGQYEININKNILEINELIKYFGGNVDDDKTNYELLFENIKFYNFLHQKKLAKVN